MTSNTSKQLINVDLEVTKAYPLTTKENPTAPDSLVYKTF